MMVVLPASAPLRSLLRLQFGVHSPTCVMAGHRRHRVDRVAAATTNRMAGYCCENQSLSKASR